MLVEAVRESISDAEQRKAAVEVELETLREIQGLAEKLNGGGTVPDPAAVQTSGPAAPSRTTQPPADPPTRSQAPRSAPKSSQGTSTGRRAAQLTRAGSPESAPAVDGRRGRNYDAAEILEKTRQTITGKFQSVTFSVSEIVRELGYPDKNDRALAAVRHAVLDLVGEKVIAEAGKGRGGHPRYAVAGAAEQPAQETGELVDRIVEQLEVDGGRVSRLDLKARVGDPDFEEFGFALERLTTEGKITTTRAGGVAGYELVR